MLSTAFLVVLIVAIGTRLADGIRVRQQEVILSKLDTPEAHAYYQILRRRIRRVQLLRAIALVALVTIFYSYKHRFLQRSAPRPAPAAVTPRS